MPGPGSSPGEGGQPWRHGPNGQDPAPRGRSGVSGKAVVAIVLSVLALIFVFQNTNSARIDLFFWHVTAPTWIWLLVLFVGGVVVGSIFPWFRRRSRRDG